MKYLIGLLKWLNRKWGKYDERKVPERMIVLIKWGNAILMKERKVGPEIQGY